MPESMTVDRLIAACRRGRDYEEVARNCHGLVTATNLRELAKPPGLGRGSRKWANFLDPVTAIGLCYGLGVRMDVVLAAQARSIFEWHMRIKADQVPEGIDMLNLPAEPGPLAQWLPYRPDDIATVFAQFAELIRTANIHGLMPDRPAPKE